MRSGLPRLSLLDELGLDDQLVGAALEDGELVVDVDGHGVDGQAGVCYNPAAVADSGQGRNLRLVDAKREF